MIETHAAKHRSRHRRRPACRCCGAHRAAAARAGGMAGRGRRRCLEILAHGLGGHRAILFRLRELPGKGFAQSIAAYWVDEHGRRHRPARRPSSSSRSSIPIRCSCGSPKRSGRARCSPAAPARSTASCARTSRSQKIKSFLSVAVFAHGHLWGTLAINDCVVERDWTDDEKAAMEIVALAHRRRHRALAVGRPCQRDHPPDHAAGLARRHHRHRRDRQHHRIQSGRRAHLRLASAPRSSARTCWTRSIPRILPQGLLRPAPTTWPGAARRWSASAWRR